MTFRMSYPARPLGLIATTVVLLPFSAAALDGFSTEDIVAGNAISADQMRERFEILEAAVDDLASPASVRTAPTEMDAETSNTAWDAILTTPPISVPRPGMGLSVSLLPGSSGPSLIGVYSPQSIALGEFRLVRIEDGATTEETVIFSTPLNHRGADTFRAIELPPTVIGTLDEPDPGEYRYRLDVRAFDASTIEIHNVVLGARIL